MVFCPYRLRWSHAAFLARLQTAVSCSIGPPKAPNGISPRQGLGRWEDGHVTRGQFFNYYTPMAVFLGVFETHYSDNGYGGHCRKLIQIPQCSGMFNHAAVAFVRRGVPLSEPCPVLLGIAERW